MPESFPATKEYDRHTSVADEMLSEQYAQSLKVSAVGRVYADAMRAELVQAVAARDAELKKLRWLLEQVEDSIALRELQEEYEAGLLEEPDA